MPPRRALCVPCWPSPCSPRRWRLAVAFARPRDAQCGQPSRKSTRGCSAQIATETVASRSAPRRHGRQEAPLFSDSGRSFLMFATRGRTWLALGDRVGPPAEWADLVRSFIELADRHRRQGCVLSDTRHRSIPPHLEAGVESSRTRRNTARISPPSFRPQALCSSRSPLCPQAWRA